MARTSNTWASATGLALTAVLACSSTGVELGKNPGTGSGGSANDIDAADPASGGASSATGGTMHPASGGTMHPASGGTANPASGGTMHPASGGTMHPASGGTASPGSGGSPDCSVIGCGMPPICGESCGAPCGCCGCARNDFTEVNGSAYQCAGDCYSPATYGYADIATDAFRFAIVKKDEHRNLCFRIIMGTGSHAPLHILTSPPLVVEAAYMTTNSADCDSTSPVPPSGATIPIDLTGRVLTVKDAKGICTVDLDATMYLSDSDASATETLRSPPIALPIFACQ